MIARDTTRGQHAGFTLLEILIVMEVLVIALGLGMAVLTGALQLWKASAQAQTQCNERAALADQFRGDVRQATATAPSAGSWTAGPTCLILQRGDNRYFVYRWHGRRLERVEVPGGKTQPIPLGVERADVEFAKQGDKLLMIRLKQPRSGLQAGRAQEITAVLGGDFQ